MDSYNKNGRELVYL